MAALDDDVVIVTGASKGLGRSMARRFLEEGARVALVARSEDRLEEVAETAPDRALVAPADVSDEVAVRRTVGRTLDRFDGIDCLVNNAAIGQGHLGEEPSRVGDIAIDTWDRILGVNLRGPFLLSRAVLPTFVAAGRGNIVNVTSGAGSHPFPRWAPYVVSKFGLEGLTANLAVEYADDGINVNGLDPAGKVRTDFQRLAPGTTDADLESMPGPDVLNEAAVLLAAQGPDGVTGESLSWEGWERRLAE